MDVDTPAWRAGEEYCGGYLVAFAFEDIGCNGFLSGMACGRLGPMLIGTVSRSLSRSFSSSRVRSFVGSSPGPLSLSIVLVQAALAVGYMVYSWSRLLSRSSFSLEQTFSEAFH